MASAVAPLAVNEKSGLPCKVILANKIAERLLSEVKQELTKLTRTPHLHGYLANADPAARMYAEWTAKTCRANGFDFTLHELDREALEDVLRTANKDDKVDGVIVYYPVYGTSRDQTLQWTVSMYKDVEGLTPQLISNMYQNIRFLDPPQNLRKSILPCTPLAVLKILEYLQIYNTILDYGQRLYGRRITVINRSEVVGRPLAALLANDGAEVYSVDVSGVQRFSRGQGLKMQKHESYDLPDWDLERCLQNSEVVISGVPGEKFKVPTEHIREGAICINFSSEKACLNAYDTARLASLIVVQNFHPDVKEKASIYVPAIGKVTIVILMRNLLRMVQNQTRVAESLES